MKSKTRWLATVAILAALAAVMMLFRFPLPFLPNFYKLHFSESVVVLGGYVVGPGGAVLIQAIKVVLKILTSGSNSMLIGDLANMIMGLSFALPAILYYRRHPNTMGVIVGLVLGVLCQTVVGCLVNYYILIPMYATAFGMSIDDIIAAYANLNADVTSLTKFVLFFTAPFNLIQGILDSIIVVIVYKAAHQLFKPYEEELQKAAQ
jgi:riboflavin transporter FmnP